MNTKKLENEIETMKDSIAKMERELAAQKATTVLKRGLYLRSPQGSKILVIKGYIDQEIFKSVMIQGARTSTVAVGSILNYSQNELKRMEIWND